MEGWPVRLDEISVSAAEAKFPTTRASPLEESKLSNFAAYFVNTVSGYCKVIVKEL